MKKAITHNLMNIPGTRTSRKFVVLESDDWGSIRTSSVDSLNYLHSKGHPVFENPYCKYDSLESDEDVRLLFDVLHSVKDKNGNPAVITANNIVANPDFEKIRKSNFLEYHYEPFTETLKKYPRHGNVWQLYKQGVDEKLFWPQYHGREHVNVTRWLQALQNNTDYMLDAFNCGMFSLHTQMKPVYFNQYMDSLDCDSSKDIQVTSDIVADGAGLFSTTWGFASRSFIAPCYIWAKEHEAVLSSRGVKYLQGLPNQFAPRLQQGTAYKKIYHYTGQKNKYNQRYLVRNAFFEPTPYPQRDWIDECMHRINIAFRWNKPAIISSHRLNYIGFLYPENRDKNLQLLKTLLKTIVTKWPDTEFVSSDKLGDILF